MSREQRKEWLIRERWLRGKKNESERERIFTCISLVEATRVRGYHDIEQLVSFTSRRFQESFILLKVVDKPFRPLLQPPRIDVCDLCQIFGFIKAVAPYYLTTKVNVTEVLQSPHVPGPVGL